MSNLTETAYITRKIFKYGWIGLVVLIFLRLGLIYSISLYKYLNPPPPPPPTCGFGTMADISFPQKGGYSYNFEYESPNGKFPTFPQQTLVYYMPYQRATFSAFDEAKSIANSLGFTVEPKKNSDEEYEWVKNLPSPLRLKVNITNGSYSMHYQWQTDPALLAEKKLQGKEQTISMASRYITTSTSSDINFEEPIITYLKASGNTMVNAESLSEADFVKADFFRKDIKPPENIEAYPGISKEALKVVTPKPDEGIITIVLSGNSVTEKQVIGLDYIYFPINYNYSETYPLKPVATAWQELTQGQGYIAQVYANPSTVTVRRVSLAYYDAKIPQSFMQPVYVFSSPDENFTAYVPALAPCSSQNTQ